MRAIIFANGIMKNWPLNFKIVPDEDMIIAADGGTTHCIQHDLIPNIILGDMDSVQPADLIRFEKMGTRIVRFPIKKDETDLELAIREAIHHGADEIHILGALGARWDMTLSNVLILASSSLKDRNIKLIDDGVEIFCLHGDQETRITGKQGDTVSLLPIDKAVTGIYLEGFEYPLENATLPLGTTQGISNVLTQKTALVKIKGGRLLITIMRST